MIEKKLELLNDLTSPLFRIMAVYNDNQSNKGFNNNICAFHIGGGLILSVAHNLRMSDNLPMIITEEIFERIRSNLKGKDFTSFNQVYILNRTDNKRYIQPKDKGTLERMAKFFQKINFDRRFITLYQTNCCKPFLIVQFRNESFYDNPDLMQHIDNYHRFQEPSINRYTFIIELELIESFFSEDITIYKITNTNQAIIDALPKIEPDFALYDINTNDYYCLQVAPFNNLGRLIQDVRIEGLLDNFVIQPDLYGGNYIMDGSRYLIKGYFRFGSSGAPYLKYDETNDVFKVNSIQSQACPIQLSINNSMIGNYQYINAVATPLNIVQNRLEEIINEAH